MNFLNELLIATANLPNPNQGFDWIKDVIEQVIFVGVAFVLLKFVFKLKIGQIVISILIGGVVYYSIRNTEKVFGWIEAFLNTF
ncbi:hypothetical protein GCM10008931_31420 [Oceanobacillus oncorhynchi subsp. oncorhynchi]|uniref:hypothetical protein n=1 Tax=Oceanobacillus oncorhynchi TaxID=545501 RepID=UPI0031E1ADA9